MHGLFATWVVVQFNRFGQCTAPLLLLLLLLDMEMHYWAFGR